MLTVLCADVPLEAPEDRRWPPLLAARLRRARVLKRHRDDQPIPSLAPLEAWLSEQFGLQTGGLVTVAAYRRFAPQAGRPLSVSPNETAATTLTATPSYFQAGMDHLVLHAGENLAITREHADPLIAAANEFLAGDGISLSLTASDSWLLHLPAPMDLELRSSVQAAGRNVHAYMPAGPDGRRLRALLNELQMLWHEHPVNQARQSEGLPPVNTLWVEGATDTQIPLRNKPFARIISADPILQGLAHASGLAGEQIQTELTPEQAAVTGGEQTLLHGQGADILNRLDLVLQRSPRAVRVVLTGEREWIEVLCGPRDRFAFWRRTSLLRQPPSSQDKP